ncbi:MAG: NADH-quinone oxidoreductase subunit NuoE [Anaerolineales bacterium]|nr:NADH-quinone oxidoreductase subunit NuoE [Anaerolineales bacterium]
MLAEKYTEEISEILEKYPPEQKRSAVMPLLYLVQREYGYVPKDALDEVAEILEMDPTEVGSLVGYYTLYYDKPEGKYRIQICTDLPCALRGAEIFAHRLCDSLGIQPGETTSDGLITVETVMCLAACDRAPMFQLQEPEGIHYHENMTVESTLELIEELRRKAQDG